MKFLETLSKSLAGKIMVAGLVLAGFFASFGAASASAEPVYVVGPHVVVRGYYGPRVDYWGPRYYYGPRGRVIIVHRRYWDPRFHCWRYR